MRKLFIYIVLLILCYSCSNILCDDYHHLISSSGDQCLTIVKRDYFFNGKNQKMPAGTYIYYGKYVKGDSMPDKYLKVEFFDDPLFIQWTKPIILSYDHVSDDKLDSLNMVNIPDAKLFDSIARKKKLVYGENVEDFFLDNIFNNEIEKLRERRKQRFNSSKKDE